MDSMALSLFRLSQFYVAEINRGYRDAGNYILQTSPPDIVDRIRGAALNTTTSPASEPEMSSSSSSAPSPSASAASDSQPSTSSVSDRVSDDQPAEETAMLSSIERAASVIESGRITLDCKLSVFTVVGTLEPRVVRLFPSVTCSCPSKGGCYHVKAAQLAIGLRESTSRKPLNLTQLRKNKRKRQDKTSGRKRPRADDVDVEPAGDADDDIAAIIANVVADNNVEPAIDAVVEPTADDIEPDRPSVVQHVNEDDDNEPVIDSAVNVERVDSRCVECGMEDPPSHLSRSRKIAWIQCDTCSYWYHKCCLSKLPRGKKEFKCHRC